jgi:hypothetical protein
VKKLLSILLGLFLLVGCSAKPKLPENVSQDVFDKVTKWVLFFDEKEKDKTPLTENETIQFTSYVNSISENPIATKEEKKLGSAILDVGGSYGFYFLKLTDNAFNDYKKYKQILEDMLNK